jgi:adenosylcobinamide-GDP ribazoletransferase
VVAGERHLGPLQAPVFALQFLTRLPLPTLDLRDGDLARATGWFPAVGALVGLVVGGVGTGLLHLGLAAGPAAVLSVAVGIIATGGLHEDGLGDTADGMGGRTRCRALEIMRDSRSGSYGVLALGTLLLLRVTALSALAPERWLLALVLAHAAGRWGALLLLRLLPYARVEQLGVAAPMISGLGRTQVAIGTLSVAAVAAPLGTVGGAVLLLSLLLVLGWRAILLRWLGGTTGDTLGAAVCLIEVLVLVGLTLA